MEKRKAWIFASLAAAAILVTAALAIILPRVGVATAEPSVQSRFFSSSVSMDDIGIALVENGEVIAERRYNNEDMNGSWMGTVNGELFTKAPKNGNAMPSQEAIDAKEDKIVLEKEYNEVLSVRNTGTINEYVRVTLYRYWLNADGKTRLTELSPELIEISLDESWENSWQRDGSAHTDERDVYYYRSLLKAGEDNETAPLTASVRIDNAVAKELEQEVDGNTIVTRYKYNGVYFVIEATADGVQENNAAEAITSAWGISASVDEEAGTLSLN